MKKEVKITKEEHDAYRKSLLVVIFVSLVIIAAFIFLVPDKIMEGILVLVAFSLALELLVFGWVFRLRYQLLGPLTKYEKDYDESMELEEID